jgi:uncharacterized membrane protein (UPF0127 family)
MQRSQPVKAVVVIGFAILIIGLPAAMFTMFFPKKEPTIAVKINNYKIRATVADSEEERQKGLSGTKSLRQGNGKLFVFPNSGYWGIWMKDMKYSLDIIWLNEDKSVVFIKEQASPDSYPQVFTSRVPSRYVLEVNSGTVSEHSIKLGDKAEFNTAESGSKL